MTLVSRLDKWLWSVRVFKTRALASEACRAGNVAVADQVSKPSRDVRPGEVIRVQQGLITRTIQVVALPLARVGAKRVPEFCLELTPPAEFEKAREQRMQHMLARERGAGRPTKRDRRQLDQLLGE